MGPKTPKESDQVNAWPVHRVRALALAKAARETFFRRASAGVGITQEANARLEAIASEATRIAVAIEFWQTGNVSADLRTQALARLRDMYAEARELGADLW